MAVTVVLYGDTAAPRGSLSCAGHAPMSPRAPLAAGPTGTLASLVPLLGEQLASLAKSPDLLLVYFIQMLDS